MDRADRTAAPYTPPPPSRTALSAISSGESPTRCTYTRTRSRVGPPSNRCTGRPAALPVMSHRATSIAPIAAIASEPPLNRQRRNMCCQCRSISVGSLPIRYSAQYLTAARTANGVPLPPLPPCRSPMPTSPSSVVTLTHWWIEALSVSTLVTFIGAPPVKAYSAEYSRVRRPSQTVFPNVTVQS